MISALDDEIVLHILSFLLLRDVLCVRNVSKRLQQLANIHLTSTLPGKIHGFFLEVRCADLAICSGKDVNIRLRCVGFDPTSFRMNFRPTSSLPRSFLLPEHLFAGKKRKREGGRISLSSTAWPKDVCHAIQHRTEASITFDGASSATACEDHLSVDYSVSGECGLLGLTIDAITASVSWVLGPTPTSAEPSPTERKKISNVCLECARTFVDKKDFLRHSAITGHGIPKYQGV